MSPFAIARARPAANRVKVGPSCLFAAPDEDMLRGDDDMAFLWDRTGYRKDNRCLP